MLGVKGHLGPLGEGVGAPPVLEVQVDVEELVAEARRGPQGLVISLKEKTKVQVAPLSRMRISKRSKRPWKGAKALSFG